MRLVNCWTYQDVAGSLRVDNGEVGVALKLYVLQPRPRHSGRAALNMAQTASCRHTLPHLINGVAQTATHRHTLPHLINVPEVVMDVLGELLDLEREREREREREKGVVE